MVKHNHTRTRPCVRHPARKHVADDSTRGQLIRELKDVKDRLEFVCSAVRVGIGVLESQAADLDLDVAATLRKSVSDVLARPIARLQVVLRRLEDQPPTKEPPQPPRARS